jgi:NAD(P)H dehydrogenase (quinone)
MKIFIVYYHPEPKSFNGSMLRAAVSSLGKAGHEVRIADLHEMDFNPVSGRHNFTGIKDTDFFKQQIEELHASEEDGFSEEVEAELQKLEWCDLMVWQFPLWWFGLPAPLKGWVDRTFAMGRTYGNGRFYDDGIFKGKTAMLSLTTGGPEEAYLSGGFNGDINGILRPIHRGMLEFVGFRVLAPNIVWGPAHLSAAEREEMLVRYSRRLENISTESPIEIGAYS